MRLSKEHYSPLGRSPLLPQSSCAARLKLQNLHVLLFLVCYKRENYRGAKRINVVKSGRRSEKPVCKTNGAGLVSRHAWALHRDRQGFWATEKPAVMSQGPRVRALRRWGCPLQSDAGTCWIQTFLGLFGDQEITSINLEGQFFNHISGIPLCSYKHRQITWNENKPLNLLPSSSSRKTSSENGATFLLAAAVHSSQLTGLSLVIQLFARCWPVVPQWLCQSITMQQGNPSCHPGAAQKETGS